MARAPIVLIVAALFGVLLSAFGAERMRICRGDAQCLTGSAAVLLPVAKLLSSPGPKPATAEDIGLRR